jgi:hypothetical protein
MDGKWDLLTRSSIISTLAQAAIALLIALIAMDLITRLATRLRASDFAIYRHGQKAPIDLGGSKAPTDAPAKREIS